MNRCPRTAFRWNRLSCTTAGRGESVLSRSFCRKCNDLKTEQAASLRLRDRDLDFCEVLLGVALEEHAWAFQVDLPAGNGEFQVFLPGAGPEFLIGGAHLVVGPPVQQAEAVDCRQGPDGDPFDLDRPADGDAGLDVRVIFLVAFVVIEIEKVSSDPPSHASSQLREGLRAIAVFPLEAYAGHH